MSTAEKDRFHNLLLLAKESPFEGERKNALQAAERLAERHGMTLAEAARARETEHQRPERDFAAERAAAEAEAQRRAFAEMARFVRTMEEHAATDKKRRDEALKAAYARGLDAEERRQAERRAKREFQMPRRNNNGRRRNPESHARVLLRETHLPLREIASICDLDVWTVAELKLKMRRNAAN